MTEKELQAAIVRLSRQLGYFVYHTKYSIGSAPGFPDLVICGHNRTIFVEVKGPRGRVSESQQQWIEALQAAGQTALIAYPEDFDTVMQLLQDAYEAAFRSDAA